VEIAFFDRGPVDTARLVTAGFWSSYWYNGRIYATEIARGLDVFRLVPSEHLSQNEIDAATQVRFDELNAQVQPRVTWPATPVVARAYLDQLTRSRVLSSERAEAVKSAVRDAERAGARKDPETAGRLQQLGAELEAQAGSAQGPAGMRLRSLAATLRDLRPATR
jgi:hypothetical protein